MFEQVPPTAHIPAMVNCTRILLNRELVGNLNVTDEDNDDGDIFVCGDCDDSILLISQLLGWEEELRVLHAETTKKLDEAA
jgi:hypothetical protein